MSEELERILDEKFLSALRPGFVTHKGIFMLDNFVENQKDIENFEVRDSDIWVSSFPKSGTTWMQEMVWLIANDLDFEGAKVIIPKRFPFIEFKSVLDFNYYQKHHPDFVCDESILDPVKALAKQKSVRLIKTHLPWNFLPLQIQNQSTKAKIIHVIRNPKDALISYFHHSRAVEGSRENFEEFFKLFMAGKVLFGPYFDNIMGYWVRRHLPNVLVVTYEEMRKDLPAVICKVAKFLDKRINSKQIEKLAKHLSFEEMKKNPAVNYEPLIEIVKKCVGDVYESDGIFMRTGIVGSHKNQMTEEMIKTMDKWIEENTAGTGLQL